MAFGFDVANVGRRSTSIREAGFLIERRLFPGEFRNLPENAPRPPVEKGKKPGTIRMQWSLEQFRYGARSVREAQPLLEPGEIVGYLVAVDPMFRSLFTRKEGRFDEAAGLVPYAIDSDDHRWTGDPLPAEGLFSFWESRGAKSPAKVRGCPLSRGWAWELGGSRRPKQ